MKNGMLWSYFIMIMIMSFGNIVYCRTYDHEELPFVVLICSYNTAEWVEKNLSSVARQHYSNYRIIYVDDASEDGTADCVRVCAERLGLSDKLLLISNKKRRRKLANMYDAIHQCADNEIIILLDGDDRLEDDRFIFKKINAAYHEHNAWFTYSHYRNEPASEAEKWGFRKMGYSAPVPSRIKKAKAYRSHTFVFMHLRTFYAWLFKQIQLTDLIAMHVPNYRNNFYPAANDLAIVFPMVEMAHDHVYFMEDVLCVRNLYSNIVGFKVDNGLQTAASAEIRKREPYQELMASKPAPITKAHGPIDACLFFKENMLDLCRDIQVLKKNVQGLRTVVILYELNNESLSYVREIKKMFNVEVCAYGDYAKRTLADAIEQYVNASKAQYLLVCVGDANPQKMSIKKCAQQLEKTGAYGFYLTQEKPPADVVYDATIYAWRFCCAKGKWRKPHGLGWALYRAADVCHLVLNSSHNKKNDIGYWCKQVVEHAKIGLIQIT